jgi:AcrR family transcriptional regulator
MSDEASEAIYTATIELLSEVGVDGFTLRDVVSRAGVGLATIYRRWPAKSALVVDTITRVMSQNVADPVADTAAESVHALVHRHVSTLRDTPVGAALPAIVAEATRSPAVAATFQGWLAGRRALIQEALRVGVARGEFRADLDIDIAFDLLAGPPYYRLLFLGEPVTDDYAARLADEFIRWASPPTAPKPRRSRASAAAGRRKA